MNSSSDQIKETILARTDLKNIICEKVKLTNKGHIDVGLCPFHNEKSPSFTVYPDSFYCFGCKESGDAISFVRKTQGLSFIEALQYLGARAGVDTQSLNKRHVSKEETQTRTQHMAALNDAWEYFSRNLLSAQGESVRKYLISRGFHEKHFSWFGFAPNAASGQALLNELHKNGYGKGVVHDCSLASVSSKDQQHYDFFRNRLIVPIKDQHGRLIAFGGRALDDFPPKYKNSRDSLLFDKSKVLFGLFEARDSIRSEESVIVVEGYMDVLQLRSFGINNVVACMGTALKASHLSLIKRFCKKVYLLFDGDSAGEKATLSTLDHVLNVGGMDAYVIRLPSGEDPDSYVQKNGAHSLKALLDEAQPLFEFVIKSHVENSTESLGLTEIIRKEIMPWLSQLNDPLTRGHLTHKLSELTGIPTKILQSTLSTSFSENVAPPTVQENTESPEPTQTKALSSLQKEFLIHLALVEDEAIEMEALKSCLTQIQLSFPWQELASHLIAKIQDPSIVLPVELASIDRILDFLEYIPSQRERFETPDRLNKIQQLSQLHAKKSMQQKISLLKQQLLSAPSEHSRDILVEISQINKDLKALGNTNAQIES